MKTRPFAGWDLGLIGRIDPERGSDGEMLELLPQSRYRDAATAKLHAYGAGPFCRFRIGRGQHEPGLYVLTMDGQPVYAGECVDLDQRWGPNGYGGISPRNCFQSGQPTNCRVNAAILSATKQGRVLELWFRAFDGDTSQRREAETMLIRSLAPPWNRAKVPRAASSVVDAEV